MTPCKGCGKTIIWGQTPDGKKIPLDPVAPTYTIMGPGPDGNPVAIRASSTYVSHFATCPKANEFSRKKAPDANP